MPKLPMDYSKCCIYKIEHVDDDSLVYVGHTTNFDKRKWDHKSNSKNEKCKKYNLKLYQMIREHGGWDAFKMIEVEKFSCNDKREAEKREDEAMKELKANMNMRNSFTTEAERKEYMKYYNKEYYKEYYEVNKSKFNAKIKCECGCEVVKRNLKEHQSTKKHLDEIKNINSSVQ